MSSHKRHGAHAHTSTVQDQAASQPAQSGGTSLSSQTSKRRHASILSSGRISEQHDGCDRVEASSKPRSHRRRADAGLQRKSVRGSRFIASSLWLYTVVFIGGFLGTAVRLYVSTSWNSLPQWYGIHWGTFAANLIACCAYGMFSAFLTEFLGSFVLTIRAHELWTKALLTGLCGGLSTMSTLSLEILASDMGFAYGALSVVGGVFVTLIASWLGGIIADFLVSKGFVNRERASDTVPRDEIKATAQTFVESSHDKDLSVSAKRTRRGRHS